MLSTNRKIVLVFLAVSFLLRPACLNLNAAEYTDGILQIAAFEYRFTFWPPLYTLATRGLALLVGDLEQSAKLVSILSSTVLLIPLFGLTLELAGRRAAIFALLFYMTNAIAWRWSIRVMSDSLFAVLFFWAATLCLRILWQAAEDLPSDDIATRKPIRSLVAASFLAALATLTRYQGVLLLPLGLIALRQIWLRRTDRQQSRVSVSLLLAILPWIAVLAWMVGYSWRHGQQIAERTGATLAQTLLIYWLQAESLILLFPYFVTIGVFVLFAVGLGGFIAGDRRQRQFAWSFVALALPLIAVQSMFGAFQERYLLPLVPFVMILAGAAAAHWEERARNTVVLVRVALFAILLYSFGWTVAALYFQRAAFGDIKQASLYCATLPLGVRVFSNEIYRDMPAVKMSFWAGRPVQGFTGLEQLSKGDYVCLHSCYGAIEDATAYVQSRYDATAATVFESRIVPLLPDIMEVPGTHPNPLAWFYRYQPQTFRTIVFRIDGPRPAR